MNKNNALALAFSVPLLLGIALLTFGIAPIIWALVIAIGYLIASGIVYAAIKDFIGIKEAGDAQ